MQHLTIIEHGMDLWLVKKNVDQPTMVHLSVPSWIDIFDAIEAFEEMAVPAPNDIEGVEIGTYTYDFVIEEYVMTWYPRRGAPNGWVSTHIGNAYHHDVVVRENGGGTVCMYQWYNRSQRIGTDLPRPGAFFEELEALSNNATVETTNDPITGEIVAEVDSEDPNGLAVVLYPDSWGACMHRWVIGDE